MGVCPLLLLFGLALGVSAQDLVPITSRNLSFFPYCVMFLSYISALHCFDVGIFVRDIFVSLRANSQKEVRHLVMD